jgi:TonB family protein
MLKRPFDWLDRSAAEPRLALALALSLLLHLALLLRFHPAPSPYYASRSSLTVFLSNNTAVAAAPPEQAGAPPAGAVSPEPVAPKTGVAAAAVPVTETAQPAVPAAEASAESGAAALRSVSFFANAAILDESVADETAGVPGMQDPAYVPADKLAPRPQLPAGFRVAYPEAAKVARLKERVRVAVLLDESGRVVSAIALNEAGANTALVNAAIQALRRARFQPGERAGQAVKSKVVVTVLFGYE